MQEKELNLHYAENAGVINRRMLRMNGRVKLCLVHSTIPNLVFRMLRWKIACAHGGGLFTNGFFVTRFILRLRLRANITEPFRSVGANM